MNPSALRDREFGIGDLDASQSVKVHADHFYVITCFRIPLGEGSTFHSKGSDLPFADAHLLDDEEWRRRLAESHLRAMTRELRTMADAAETQVAKLSRATAEETLYAEGLGQLEAAAGASK